jgi:hypothetical protein
MRPSPILAICLIRKYLPHYWKDTIQETLKRLTNEKYFPPTTSKSWDLISTLSFLHQQQNINNLSTVIQHTGSWKRIQLYIRLLFINCRQKRMNVIFMMTHEMTDSPYNQVYVVNQELFFSPPKKLIKNRC